MEDVIKEALQQLCGKPVVVQLRMGESDGGLIVEVFDLERQSRGKAGSLFRIGEKLGGDAIPTVVINQLKRYGPTIAKMIGFNLADSVGKFTKLIEGGNKTSA